MVVGAGFGGLAAAVRLRALGYDVEVLEAMSQPGGRAAVLERDGFRFDAGPTVITAPYLLDELFALLGKDPRDYFELLPVDPFYRVHFPSGETFDYVGEEDRILEQIRGFNPADVDGYRRLAAHARRIFDIGYTKLADVPFERLTDMLRVAPDMARLENYRSVHGLVARYIRDPRLRQVFTFQPLLIGGNPFTASSIYLLIHWLERKWGVWFPRGGTGALVRALVKLLEESGVRVRTGTPVDEIEVESGRAVAVRTAAGERVAADKVVCNADPSVVYTRLVAARHRRTWTDRAVARRRQSMSLFVAYFAAEAQPSTVAHHSILLGPRYEGLLRDIFDRRVLADDFSLYLHAPFRTDPGMAPPGTEVFYVLSPVPNQKSGIDWADEAPRYGARILDALDRGVLPGVKSRLKTWFTLDPRYFADTLRSADGSAFGLEPLLQQSAWFRYHNRSEDVQGLFFVGASTHPGAGVPGVLNTARVLARVVGPP